MEEPLFSFGIIADAQYVDIENRQNFDKTAWRYYRQSLRKLETAIENWNNSQNKVELILQLGDLIDGFNKKYSKTEEALNTIESVLNKFNGSKGIHHTWGNHEFYNFSREELHRSILFTGDGETPYYHFSPYSKMRVVVIDSYDVSTIGEIENSERYNTAKNIIKAVNPNSDLNNPDGLVGLPRRFAAVNGGFSKEQLDWLDGVLKNADDNGEWVIIMGHVPVFPSTCEPFCLSWNYDEALETLHKYSCVRMFLAGHDHSGGYACDDYGIHHLTVRGTVEAAREEDPAVTAHVYKDRLVVKNLGSRRNPIDEIVINLE